MKKKNLTKIITRFVIPSVLISSCSKSSYFDERPNSEILSRSTTPLEYQNSIVVPIDLGLSSEDYKIISFAGKVVSDIIKSPSIAKVFAENPQELAKAYGVDNVDINFNDNLWKIIFALGDEDIHAAIVADDMTKFLDLCSDKGLIPEFNKSDFIFPNSSINDGEKTIIEPRSVAAVALVAVTVLAGVWVAIAVDIALYETKAVYSSNMFWGGEEEGISASLARDSELFQIWALKKGTENIDVLQFSYNKKIINDCVEGIRKYYPEKIDSEEKETELKRLLAAQYIGKASLK